MKGKMAIIGDGDGAMVFVACGVDAYSATTPAEVENLIKKLAKEYQVIFITDVLAKQVDEVIKRYNSVAYPVILSIPGKAGSNGYGIEGLKKAMDKA
ncbi:MAG: V-type ATP synthase subunit F, partial [Clostridiales bacterium]|nr:V-type ATP synthase subunit F [Clostridiales bacterium]